MRPRLVTLLAATLIASMSAARAQSTVPLLPTGVAYDAAGNLFFADTNRHQVFESTLAGQLLVVAGSGVQGFAGDGGTATSALLNAPQGVAIGADGTLYIADTGNQRLRAVVAGQISTYAGTGRAGFGGEGGPAVNAVFNRPTALAIDATGALLICDTGNHRIRRVAAGTATTVAGTGVEGFAGDGSVATAAEFDTPSGIAVATDGRIFIADTHNHRVRVIAASGTITTFAGTGTAGYSGDGGPAVAARLSLPQGLYLTPSVLLIADSNNQRIRSVDTAANIITLAGNGTQGSSTDAAPATGAALNTPRGVALSAFAAPVFADAGNRLVRELVANGTLYLPAGLQPSRGTSVSLVATPGAAYGQPVATATVQGSASTPQGTVQLLDSGTVVASAALVNGQASFASSLLVAGTHALTARYLGDGVNPGATSPVANTTVGRSQSTTTEPPSPGSYAGLPLVLSATVAGMPGTPTGVVTFTESGTPVATATLNGGSASAVYLSPAVGTHTVVASYSGDTNFTPSSSAALAIVVGAMPDFTLAPTGSATQAVQYGAVATYAFTVAAQPAPFSGAVTMSVSGLPNGVTAAFSPSQVIPGAGTAQVILSLQIPATLGSAGRPGGYWLALFLPLAFCLSRRRSQRLLRTGMMAMILLCVVGCGDRTLSQASQGTRSFAVTVTGTGTNLAGAVVSHSTPIVLIVQ